MNSGFCNTVFQKSSSFSLSFSSFVEKNTKNLPGERDTQNDNWQPEYDGIGEHWPRCKGLHWGAEGANCESEIRSHHISLTLGGGVDTSMQVSLPQLPRCLAPGPGALGRGFPCNVGNKDAGTPRVASTGLPRLALESRPAGCGRGEWW